MKGTSIPSKNDGNKVMKYDEFFFITHFGSGLAFKYYNSLESFISAPGALID
jgi:hypothetical protein